MIQKYLSDNYSEIIGIAKVITKGRKPDYEDLAHEVIVMVLESEREKMNRLVELGEIKYWIIRLCLNNYRSSTSKYHYKYRKPEERHRKAAEHLSFIYKLDEIGQKKYNEKVLEYIEEKLEDVDWFEKNCFAIYYGDEHSLNSMAEETGINRNTLYRAIRNTREYVKDEYEKSGPRRHD